jgi:anti-sigma factor RsiW
MTDDEELVALIDNELDQSSRDALLSRLATDEQFRGRYAELRAVGAPIAASLDALLEHSARAPARRASRGQPRSSAQNRSAEPCGGHYDRDPRRRQAGSRSQLLSGRNTRFDARGRLMARPQGRPIRNLREFTRSKYVWADGIATAIGF